MANGGINDDVINSLPIDGGGPPAITGTGAITAVAGAIAGSGLETFTGTGDVTASPGAIDGSGTVSTGAITGTGDVTAPVGAVDGAVQMWYRRLPWVEPVDKRRARIDGRGAVSAPAARVDALGIVQAPPQIRGSGAAAAPAAAIASQGRTSDDAIVWFLLGEDFEEAA